MEFLVRFAHVHETFRLAEIKSLAITEAVDLTVLEYDPESPYCLIRLPSVEDAKRLIRRSILAQSIHELWGAGKTLEEVHEAVKSGTATQWQQYRNSSFKFTVESFQGTRSSEEKLVLINSFSYLPFGGVISMTTPDESFTLFEKWQFQSQLRGIEDPDFIYMGRLISASGRDFIKRYDLKKRRYISTTSMDSELSLVTANMALAAPGKLFYDPFVGTGSFPIACSHFGAICWGSDIDGMSMRGHGPNKNLRSNFVQYGLESCLGGSFTADLTNTPLKRARIWDGIVCDPPYGVREGLKVLGLKDPLKTPWLIESGKERGMLPTYVPPKKPYSFLAMLDNILQFATDMLVDQGRLCFWMPTANDETLEIPVPTHPCLEVVVVCVQAFSGWSRRLITYRRIPDDEVPKQALTAYYSRSITASDGKTADELNPFRRGYFSKFVTETETEAG